jgi:phosphoglycolate phosphatase
VARRSRVTPPYDLAVFDLDGTIIDSEPGVYEALRHACIAAFDIVPTTAQLEEFMGPPLSDVLPRVLGKADPADERRFHEAYCEAYFHGTEYDFDVYPGVLELLKDLHQAGTRLVLGTAKPDVSAERILEHAGVRELFEFVAGSHADGSRQDKIDVLAHAFENHPLDGRSAVMIGDRALDVRAARAFGLDSVVVDWGYAPPGELDDCGATHRVSDAAGLRALLLR